MTLRDFRIGLRLLLKEPGYSLAVVLGLPLARFATERYLSSFVERAPHAGGGAHLAGARAEGLIQTTLHFTENPC
jgi:hypothetical protein